MTLSLIASVTNVQSTTITAMSGISAGDVLVLIDSVNGSSGWGGGVPTNFIQAFDTGGAGQKTLVSYKLADGSESSSSISGLSVTSNQVTKILLQFRDTDVPIALTLGDPKSTITDGDPAAQTTASGSGDAPLIAFGVFANLASGVAISGDSFTSSTGSVSSGNAFSVARQKVAYKLYNSSPADETADLGDLGSKNVVGVFYLALSSSPPPVDDALDQASIVLTSYDLADSPGFDDALDQASLVLTSYAFTDNVVSDVLDQASLVLTSYALAEGGGLAESLNLASLALTSYAITEGYVLPGGGTLNESLGLSNLVLTSYPVGQAIRGRLHPSNNQAAHKPGLIFTRLVAPSLRRLRSVSSGLRKTRGSPPTLRDT